MGVTSAQRRALRARAHTLGVRLQVGGNGLSTALLLEADAVLERDELMKVRLPAGRDERDRLLAEMASRLGAELIGAIGRTGLLYRPAGHVLGADARALLKAEAASVSSPEEQETDAPPEDALPFTDSDDDAPTDADRQA